VSRQGGGGWQVVQVQEDVSLGMTGGFVQVRTC